ncbi:MAG: HAD family hydrolase [Butyrivibrio sp.]
MKRGIIFDLDGTLWDSSKEVAYSWSEAIKERPDVTKEITTDQIQSVMGKTMTDIADILFAEYDKDFRMELLDYCMEKELDYIRKHGGQIFDGVEDTFKTLREKGYCLYIVSNCQVGYIESFLDYYKLWDYIDDIESYGGTGQGKDYNIKLVVERNHIDRAVYVGDIESDYVSATKAGVPFIHARTGYGSIDADVPYITALSELPEQVKKIIG